MSIVRNFIVFVFIFSPLPSAAVIFESRAFSDVTTHIKNEKPCDVMVVVDLDNTVEETAQEVGSDQWFSYMVDKRMQEGCDVLTAVDKVLPIYVKIHNVSGVKPVESDTPALIKSLQDQGIKVMALTSRSLPVLERTLEQLADIDVDFYRDAVHLGEFSIKSDFIAQYKKGILFAGNNNKGKILSLFFDCIGCAPKKVIFVDDKLKNVQSVESTLQARGIEVVGLRYGYLDEKIKNFDAQAADKQLQQLLAAS